MEAGPVIPGATPDDSNGAAVEPPRVELSRVALFRLVPVELVAPATGTPDEKNDTHKSIGHARLNPSGPENDEAGRNWSLNFPPVSDV